jgi:predicted secreted hydrolase
MKRRLAMTPTLRKGRRRRVTVIGIAVLAALFGTCALIPAARAGTAAVKLPADESPHPGSSTEWWYFNGHLTGTDPSGKTHDYGFYFTILRTNILALEPVASLYSGQFAVTDLTRGTFDEDTFDIGLGHDNVPAKGGYNNTVGSWNMNGINGQNHIKAGDGAYGLNLSLDQPTPAALHGGDGVIDYGPYGTSGYYSETSLKTSGTVTDHGVPVKVTGISWQDHQWGNFAKGPGGWTWFAVQLRNGVQYMLYFIHDASGKSDSVIGTRVNPDGSTVNLPPGELSQTPTSSWTSPKTKITYPQDWRVSVPGGQFTITALEKNQEMTNIGTGNNWEGDSSVTGTLNGQAVTGQAYSEVMPNLTMPQPGDLGSL